MLNPVNIFNELKFLWERIKRFINTLKLIIKAVRKAIAKAMEEVPLLNVSKAKDRRVLHQAYGSDSEDSSDDGWLVADGEYRYRWSNVIFIDQRQHDAYKGEFVTIGKNHFQNLTTK